MSDDIDAHLDWMRDERYHKPYAAASVEARARILRHADRHLPRGLCDVWDHEIRDYLDRPGWTDWTRHTYDGHLRGFYAWAYREGRLTLDPMQELSVAQGGQFLPKPLTGHELRLALQRSVGSLWFTCIVLGVGAGLRASEMAGLRREDITDEYLIVRRGKGGKARIVPTCVAVWRHVQVLPAGPILHRPANEIPVTGRWLSSRQSAHFRSIGLPQVHLHRLRHSFASIMYDADHDALVIRDLMGHVSVETTQGYALVSGRKRRRAIGAVDTLLSGLVDGAPASR